MSEVVETEIKESAERDARLAKTVADMLSIPLETSNKFIVDADRLYKTKMTMRFTDLRFQNRLKRTNPFLVQGNSPGLSAGSNHP